MASIEQTVSDIAREKLSIDTLEIRRSDSLDFHSVAVWSVRSALEAAFAAGAEHARQEMAADQKDNSAKMPRQRG